MKLPSFFQKNETVQSLKVNETELAFRNVFILDLLALEDEKESKHKRTPFWGSVQKPSALERRIYVPFQTTLVLSIF